MAYYDNVNPDLLRRIPIDRTRILEIGCGSGALAAAYKARNPGCAYVGVELFEDAARQARVHLDTVICGNIENPTVFEQLAQSTTGALFDTLVFGDVLEHLTDPWTVLTKLRRLMAPGAVCVACIPNIGHWSIVESLIAGRWDYKETGLLDRTHIRFFTLATMKDMFLASGWNNVDALPRNLWPDKTRASLDRLQPVARSLGVDGARFQRDLSAFQWVLRAVNGSTPQGFTVAGLGMKPLAGITDARMAHPWAAMETLPGMRVAWAPGRFVVPQGWPPGVLTLHRQFLDNSDMRAGLDSLISKGWVVVSDIDDDPAHWDGYKSNDFLAFRGVHAVTVSTEALADVVREWNPNVEVLPNAIHQLPRVSRAMPKSGERLKIFFGALNRKPDWDAIEVHVLEALKLRPGSFEFVVVHEPSIADAIRPWAPCDYHPLLSHDAYIDLLAQCDIALLPLNDTKFNRLKSDLKFIECCACETVPICARTLYGDHPDHAEIGLFPDSPEGWRDAIIELCDRRDDLLRRRQIGLRYVARQRMHAQQVEHRLAVYRGWLGRQESLERERQVRIRAI